MFLLDTNVVSELRKIRAGKADGSFTAWASQVAPAQCFLSVITLQELEIGVLLIERKDKRQGKLLRTWLDQHVMSEFADRLLDIDASVAKASAELHVPNPRPFRDSLIAATARIHGLTLVTRNTSDFEAGAIPLINPWQP